MADTKANETALGVARARFVDGLPRKAAELKAALALVVGSPDAERPREEMRRRLHALFASAQVFGLEPLAQALREGIAHLDRARDEKRGLEPAELDGIAAVGATLSALATGPAPTGGRAPSVPVRHSSASPPVPIGTTTSQASAARLGSMRAPSSSHVAAVPVAPAAPPKSSPAASGTSAPRGRPSLATVVAVLVVDDVATSSEVRTLLPSDEFEVSAASDAESGLRMARSSAPDVILVSSQIALSPELDFVARLRSDPLTDFVPVVVLVPGAERHDPMALRDTGTDETLRKPLDAEVLARTLYRLLERRGDDVTGVIGDATLDEVADRVAKAVRQGLVDAAREGRELKIPFGDGSEVVAAALSAVGKLRRAASQRSGGRVTFQDPPRKTGPAMSTLYVEDGAAEELPRDTPLAGRRILLVDDDPAVVWFFAAILREAGATVIEASHGGEALDELRRHPADVVVSDILMPVLDGFALTREMARDPALADVPVILLSWKEDYLQRMRDLKAGASAYLRKEAGAGQILRAVRDVLRPRQRLEEELATGGEVRGRLEQVGIRALLVAVARLRPSSRVTIRDAWSLFEVDMLDGNVVAVTRTATDGSFQRGEAAFEQLVGCTAARFSVSDAHGHPRATVHEPLATLLPKAQRRLGAVMDAVSGKALGRVSRVVLLSDVVESVGAASPAPVRDVIDRLARGESPRELMLSGVVSPAMLETVLVDLGRRGALTAALGADGEDQIALALAARGEARPLSLLPPGQAAAPSDETLAAVADATATASERPRTTRSEPPAERTEPSPTAASPVPESVAAANGPAEPQPHDASAIDLTAAATNEGERLSEPDPVELRSALVRSSSRPSEPGSKVPPPPPPEALAPARQPVDLIEESAAPGASGPGAPPEAGAGLGGLFDDAARQSLPPDLSALTQPAPKPPLAPPPTPSAVSAPPPSAPANAVAAVPPSTSAPPAASTKPVASTRPSETPAAARPSAAPTKPEEPQGALGGWWIVLLLALSALAFVAMKLATSSSTKHAPAAPSSVAALPTATSPASGSSAEPSSAAAGASPSPTVVPSSPDPTQPVPSASTASLPTADDLRYGRIVPGLLDPNVPVASGQGLLSVSAPDGASTEAILEVDGRVLGPAPQTIALPEGEHDLLIRVGDRELYRSVRIRAGSTYVAAVPSP